MIEYTDDVRQVDWDKALLLYRGRGPFGADLTAGALREAVLGSSYAVFAMEGGQVIGAARAISDGDAWTFLSDVTVLPQYVGTDAEKELIRRVLERFHGHEIFTVTGRESLELYEDLGFRRSRNGYTFEGYQGDVAIREPRAEYYLPLGYLYDTEQLSKESKPAGSGPAYRKSTKNLSPEDVRYTADPEEVDFEQLNALLMRAFGGHPRDLATTKRVFETSRYVSYAFLGERLVGCARAVSDSRTQGLILNVAVDPDYQGLHIGLKVVELLGEQMKGQSVYLNTHPGAVGFYNRKPFLRNKTALLFPAHPDMPEEMAKGFMLPKGYRFPDE
ncbi:MAG: GNAT family N-acetyltransferase [Lachnospiraceae bacterium]|nr:GNAT family N-acetyltransferase [Lachnospiraceae bacterium]